MSTRLQKQLGASGLVILAIAFVLAVILSNLLFKGVRIDLTENHLYTLSDGTKRILRGIDEPLNLYFYYSDQASESLPSLRDYATRVREMLEEFRDESGGKLRLSVIDPLPFSEDEDRAAEFGLRGVQLGSAPDPVYLGLAGTNSVGDQEIIAFFQPDQEAFLEYDIARLVSSLADPQRTVVGVVSGVQMTRSFDPQSQRMQPAWVVYEQAEQLFEMRSLGTSFDTVPEDVNVLWIVQPKNLSSTTQYAIDQFVMRGGKALIFVDPVAAVDAASDDDMPQGMPPMGQGSDLPALFHGWGIDFSAQQVVADAQQALQVNTGISGRPARHYGYLGITPERMSHDDIVTADLGSVNVAMAGSLKLAEGSTATFEPLLTSSPASALMPASRFAFLPDPAALQKDFVAGGAPLVIAARIGGTLHSAFPDGKPQADTDDGDADTSEQAEHVTESSGPANLIVVADVDMLSNPMWVSVQSFFGQQLANAFAGNGAFVSNALDSLSGSSDLIAVRSRGSFARPFTKVDELRAGAESRYLETEERLQRELDETERRLGELQSSREDSGSLLLTDEQQAEIDRFIDQRSTIRKELRAVQRGLDEDIETLGTWLKVINIGLMPLLLTLATLLVLWRRREASK